MKAILWRLANLFARRQRETEKLIEQHPGMEMLRMRRIDPPTGQIVDTRRKP